MAAITAEELRILIKAETGKAQAELKRFKKTSKDTTSSLKKMGKQLMGPLGLTVGFGLVVVAARKVINTMKDMFILYGEQETAVAKLDAAILATGKSFTISTPALVRFAGELQSVTTYGDEVTIGAMAMLQQLSNLNQEGLKKVTPAMLDFAAAMKVDLNTAASLIGKTLGSSTNALSRYGISLDMTMGPTEKLAQLTEELTKKFGGMAEAVSETTVGALQQLRNEIGDFKEKAGKGLADFYEPAITGFKNLLSKINEAIAAKRLMDDVFSGRSTDFEGAIIRQKVVLQGIRDDYKSWIGDFGQYEGTSGWAEQEKKHFDKIVMAQRELIWLQKQLDAQGALPASEAGGYSAEERDADMKALEAAFAKTTRGQREAAAAQIKYFESFKQIGRVVDVLAELRAEYKRLYEEVAASPIIDIGPIIKSGTLASLQREIAEEMLNASLVLDEFTDGVYENEEAVETLSIGYNKFGTMAEHALRRTRDAQRALIEETPEVAKAFQFMGAIALDSMGTAAQAMRDLADAEAMTLRKSIDDITAGLEKMAGDAALGAAINMFRDLGRSLVETGEGAMTAGDAIAGFISSLVQVLPQLMLNAGLAILTLNPASATGWALIIGSGLLALVSGAISGSLDNNSSSASSSIPSPEAMRTATTSTGDTIIISPQGDMLIRDMSEAEAIGAMAKAAGHR